MTGFVRENAYAGSRWHGTVFFFAVLRDVAVTGAHDFRARAHHDLRLLEWLFDFFHPFLEFSLGLKMRRKRNKILNRITKYKWKVACQGMKPDVEELSEYIYPIVSFRGDLMVSALDSGPGSNPDWGHCVVFLGKTLYSHSASLHPGV